MMGKYRAAAILEKVKKLFSVFVSLHYFSVKQLSIIRSSNVKLSLFFPLIYFWDNHVINKLLQWKILSILPKTEKENTTLWFKKRDVIKRSVALAELLNREVFRLASNFSEKTIFPPVCFTSKQEKHWRTSYMNSEKAETLL